MIRDPLANDWIAVDPATRESSTEVFTAINYDTATGKPKATSVTQPAPASGQARPAHTYRYVNGGETQVDVAGLAPASGFARKVTFDAGYRKLTDTDATGKTSRQEWNVKDQVVAAIDPAGRKTTTIYDHADRPTDTYGPAPESCFNGLAPTAACASTVDHNRTEYDGGINSLAVSLYDNRELAGAPKVYVTGIGTADGSFARNLGSEAPVPGFPADHFSLRATGEIVFPQAGTYTLRVLADDGVRLWVDDQIVIDDWRNTTAAWRQGNVTSPTAGAIKRIRVEHYEYDLTAQLELHWTTPSGLQQVVPGTQLRPRYGLTTSATEDESGGVPNKVATTRYNDNGVDPIYGLATATVADPGGLNLTAGAAYETPGTGYLRRTSKTMPSGVQSGTVYYGDAEARDNPCTPAVDLANQGGLPKLTTLPAPATGPARVDEQVYDASGRTVAEAVNGTWICTRYDARDRVIEKTYPANPAAAARAVTTNYAAGGDPQTTTVTDSTGTITARVDLVGRTVLYVDVHGTRTETRYDQAGRVTSEIVTPPDIADSPQTTEYRYDDAGRVLEVKLLATVNGAPTTTVLAMPGYDAAGELASVNYGSGTSLTAIGKDQAGRGTSLTWRKPDATQVVSTVTRSRAGTITDETLAGVDARPTGPNYLYDAVGRLTDAWVTGHHYTYDFTTAPTGCPTGTQPNAGTNTNRLRLIDATGTGTTETGYCYDAADRILATTGANPVTGITYDDHGNTTQHIQGAVTTQLGWDSADRNLTASTTSTNPADVAQVTYGRDATDRITRRDTTQGDTPAAVLYSYTADGDTADLVLDANKRAVSRTISLPGGVLWTATLDAQGNTTARYDHPTVRGDLTLSTDAAGVQLGDLRTYTPFGEPLTAAGVVDPDNVPDNQTGQLDYGWLGQHQRPYEHAGALSLVQMGARPYSPLLSRFLSVDPVEGGSANDYDYTNANPINTTDLDGRCPPCAAAAAAAGAIPASAFIAVGAIVVGAFGVAMASRHSFAMPARWTSNRRSLSFKGRSYGYRITYGNGKTWKYGITSGSNPYARPNRQLRTCMRQMRSECKVGRLKGPFPTKWQARMWEHARIMHYKRIHGVCPPGQRKSCR